VECGLKPKFVLIKNVNGAANNWEIYDSVREQYNQMSNELIPNGSYSEGATLNTNIDFTANGFKIRGTDGEMNANGTTYIFYAVADVPAKYSLAR
jgi:hypothetical protein